MHRCRRASLFLVNSEGAVGSGSGLIVGCTCGSDCSSASSRAASLRIASAIARRSRTTCSPIRLSHAWTVVAETAAWVNAKDSGASGARAAEGRDLLQFCLDDCEQVVGPHAIEGRRNIDGPVTELGPDDVDGVDRELYGSAQGLEHRLGNDP